MAKAALLSVVSGETKTSSVFFTKQKRDAIRMMHTPRTMFLFTFATAFDSLNRLLLASVGE